MASNFFSIIWCGEAFYKLGVQDVKSLILVGALFTLDGGGRKERKKKKSRKKSPQGRISPETDPPCWLCSGVTAVMSN
jgi:hypothetical protein